MIRRTAFASIPSPYSENIYKKKRLYHQSYKFPKLNFRYGKVKEPYLRYIWYDVICIFVGFPESKLFLFLTYSLATKLESPKPRRRFFSIQSYLLWSVLSIFPQNPKPKHCNLNCPWPTCRPLST